MPFQPLKEKVAYLMATMGVGPMQFINVMKLLYPLDTMYLPCNMEDGAQVLLLHGKRIKNTELRQTVTKMEKEGLGQIKFMK